MHFQMGVHIGKIDFPLHIIIVLKKRTMPSRSRYSKITLQKRKKLVDMVQNQHYSIKKAAKRLSLKVITARFIINKFKEQGRFTIRKRDLLQQPSREPQEEAGIQVESSNEAPDMSRENRPNSRESSVGDNKQGMQVQLGWFWNGFGFVLCPIMM